MGTIGDRLREKRLEKGYETARGAAKAYGWNENTYRSHENGTREPPKDMLLLYAKCFGTSVSWLLQGIEEGGGRKGRQEGQSLRILEWDDLPSGGRRSMLQTLRTATRGAIVMPYKVGSDDCFVLTVRDNSMVSPTGDAYSLYPNDTIVCDTQGRIAPGKTVLVYDPEDKINVVRKIQALGSGRYRCVPLNPDFRSFEIASDDPGLLAVVVQFHRFM